MADDKIYLNNPNGFYSTYSKTANNVYEEEEDKIEQLLKFIDEEETDFKDSSCYYINTDMLRRKIKELFYI